MSTNQSAPADKGRQIKTAALIGIETLRFRRAGHRARRITVAGNLVGTVADSTINQSTNQRHLNHEMLERHAAQSPALRERLPPFVLLLCSPPVGPCVLQCGLHFPDCNDVGVEVYRIDLFKIAKAFCNLSDTFQPFQGCLTDIISCDKENGLRKIIPLGMQHAESGEQDQSQDCTSRKGLDASSFHLDHDASPFICSNHSRR
jgi:hypothetical protein